MEPNAINFSQGFSLIIFLQVVRVQSLNIAFNIIADSADPDEIKQNTKLPFQKFWVYIGFIPHYQIS